MPGDRDLVHRVLDLPVLDPEAARATRVVARHAVHALPHQLGDVQAAIHQLQHLVEITAATVHQQVVRAARVAGGAQPELACRVRAQHVAEQHAGVDEFAIARRDTFVIERCAGQRFQQVRPLREREPVRKHTLARGFEQERCATVLAAATDRADEVTDESTRDVR